MKITFKVQKLFCECCERKFEKETYNGEKVVEINFNHMKEYLPMFENTVYKEDLSSFIEGYLSDIMEDYLKRGEVAKLNSVEEKRLQESFEQYLKEQNIEII